MAVGYNNIVVWIENFGGGSFGSPEIIAKINRPFEAQASDFNGDGHLDMVVAGRGADRVAWYSGDGSGNFVFEANLSTDFNGAAQVLPFDVDSDGDLDVIAGADIASRIVWHRNDGAGLFSAGIVITTEASNPTSLTLADLDGDGRQDLLVGSLGDDQLGWHAGTGSGISSVRNTIPTDSNGVLSAESADIDYDGIPDVFVAAFVSGTVTWYRGLGAGAFGPEQVLGTAPQTGGARSVWVADLDSDGDRDVVACIQASDVILWYEFTEELGTPYCIAESNSTGLPGRLAVTGSPNVLDNSVALNAEGG